MLHFNRSYTSPHLNRKIKYPQRYQSLQQKKRSLIQSQQFRIRNSQYKTLNNRQSQLKFQQTATSSFGRGFSHRIKSSIIQKKKIQILNTNKKINQQQILSSRPNTTQSLQKFQGNSINDIYPLQILNSMEKKKLKKDNDKKINYKTQFLKKGKGINKSILVNILKSKANKTVAQSGTNYSGCKFNKQFLQIVKNQIPLSLKDVIGPEQVLRMSNIMTGGCFKSDDMYLRINKLIDSRAKQKNKQNLQIQDRQTLKSIKRW